MPSETPSLHRTIIPRIRKSLETHGLFQTKYTGYGVKTIPGAREAIEHMKWKEADEQMQRAGAVLRRDEAALINAAAQELEKGR